MRVRCALPRWDSSSPTLPSTVTTRTMAPMPAYCPLRSTVIITTELITPATGSSECAIPPVLPSGRFGGASTMRGSDPTRCRVVRAGRCTSLMVMNSSGLISTAHGRCC